jgi:Effector-associated domain 5
MLMGVNGDFVARLDVRVNPSDQLLSDLGTMNNIAGAICGVPLERWLRNAAYDTRTQPDRQKFLASWRTRP